MRLNSIKLSGFKSFADPTNFLLPGQLVGVVGPNGCGKSNIIDAVRWVLGESRASELRGESMQDVIFNGTTSRKPSSRASVELVFDNASHRAGGQWNQFAEIAVKRVLTRDGTSSYYINNQPVRRRDVQDVFLGTGLGPRAYAIIGQGTISRIIESKPEELRLFLEEAAGVSKYKERRRETENRLGDTRENLTRVEDILRELNANLEKLERQAEVAQRFKDLQSQSALKQHQLWFLKRAEAEVSQTQLQQQTEQASNALEAKTADLRRTESQIETLRQAHYDSGEQVNQAQGQLYQATAEVGRLEAEIRFVVEGRQRAQERLQQIQMQMGQWSAQDFWRALHHGKSKDGRLLTPAFPYKHSTLISRDDSNALFAALQTLEPVQNELPIAKPSQSLRWPFASAPALAIWRSLFFKPGTYQDDPTQSKDWNRGAYLVQGLGHCAACHSPRNAWGAWGEVDDLSGGWMQGVNWFAPSLLDDSSTGLASSSLASIVQLLQTGVHDQAQVSGPMAEVVQQSTQHMSEADLMAMALYLQSRAKAYAAVKPVPLPSLNSSPSLATMSKPNFLSMGRSIYENQCEQCHGANGQGIQGAYPALSRNRAVLLQDPTNLVQSVLYGGYPPATLGNPRPFGMPPFILTLQDKEIAAVLTYIRSQWGNQATEVTPLHVHRVRALQGH